MHIPASRDERVALYRSFAQQQASHMPFLVQPWWLDAMNTPGREWDCALFFDGNAVAGVLPWWRYHKWGVGSLLPPPASHQLGPWLAPAPGQKHETRTAWQLNALTELETQLPPSSRMYITLPPELPVWLPFRWRGWQQTTLYTQTLPDITNLDTVLAGLASSVRKDIRRAEPLLHTDTCQDVELMWQLMNQTFERSGAHQPLTRQAMETRMKAAWQAGAGHQLRVYDDQGRSHATIFIIADGTGTASSWIAGTDPALRQSDAGILLYWRAIEFASATLGARSFSFMGSNLQRIEPLLRRFGTVHTPYSALWKQARWLRVADALRGR